MSGPGVGFEYPPVPVTWHKRDVLLFANSIGCTVDELHFLYVGNSKLSTCGARWLKCGSGTTPQLLRLPHLFYYSAIQGDHT